MRLEEVYGLGIPGRNKALADAGALFFVYGNTFKPLIAPRPL